MNKPKILLLVDNSKWCWFKTMQDLAYCLPEYDCDILSAHEFRGSEFDIDKYDFIYCRGSIHEFVDKDNEKDMIPFISTLCTGGKLIDGRLELIEKYAKQGWGIVVQNKEAFHRCIAEGYDNVFLIPNGVNTNVYRPPLLKSYTKLIGIAGNIEDRAELKGYNYLVPAVKKVEGIELKQVGKKQKPLTYEQMAIWYQSLHIYAQPSDSEGCSNSVMEAMASGLPVLICDGVGYHGEVCLDAREYDNGQVLFVKRNVKSIEKAINILLDDKELYDRVSKNARKFALEHDWAHIAQKYRDVFNKFLPIAKKLKLNNPALEKVDYSRLKITDNYEELSKEVYEFMAERKIDHTVSNILNVLRMKGYML